MGQAGPQRGGLGVLWQDFLTQDHPVGSAALRQLLQFRGKSEGAGGSGGLRSLEWNGFPPLSRPLIPHYRDACLRALPCMYLLTIRDGLQTRHVGPYVSPKQAADDLDRLLPLCGERARWQIHALESPAELMASLTRPAEVGVAA